MHVWVSGPQRSRLDVDVWRCDVTAILHFRPYSPQHISCNGGKFIPDPPSQLRKISRYPVCRVVKIGLKATRYSKFSNIRLFCVHKIVNMAPTKSQKAFCTFCGLKPPHFHNDVRRYLNGHLLQRWIARTGRDDKALLKWSSRSPDMTPWVFFL
ncbi:hypothetical protein TNCV_4713451 [Trichonephila clavipes]|nr:hypothetical protein TNCV_4713451 [Trichonephila clavipes]